MILAQFWQISPLSAHCSELMAHVVSICVFAENSVPGAIRAAQGQLDVKLNSSRDLEGAQNMPGSLEESKNVELWW